MPNSLIIMPGASNLFKRARYTKAPGSKVEARLFLTPKRLTIRSLGSFDTDQIR